MSLTRGQKNAIALLVLPPLGIALAFMFPLLFIVIFLSAATILTVGCLLCLWASIVYAEWTS